MSWRLLLSQVTNAKDAAEIYAFEGYRPFAEVGLGFYPNSSHHLKIH
tara:strand:- start:406 stop:546 length:141 start_codon:yes stop_codon:yes gene_type:complete